MQIRCTSLLENQHFKYFLLSIYMIAVFVLTTGINIVRFDCTCVLNDCHTENIGPLRVVFRSNRYLNTYTARPVCWSGWISDSYSSLKPLCSGMGEVVPARTSPTLLPPSPRRVAKDVWFSNYLTTLL